MWKSKVQTQNEVILPTEKLVVDVITIVFFVVFIVPLFFFYLCYKPNGKYRHGLFFLEAYVLSQFGCFYIPFAVP